MNSCKYIVIISIVVTKSMTLLRNVLAFAGVWSSMPKLFKANQVKVLSCYLC